MDGGGGGHCVTRHGLEHRQEDPRCLHGQRPTWRTGSLQGWPSRWSGGAGRGPLLGASTNGAPRASLQPSGVIPSRYLIVDDNTSFREEMRALLTEQGLDVVGGAGSAADAHRRIAELRPDVALIDID